MSRPVPTESEFLLSIYVEAGMPQVMPIRTFALRSLVAVFGLFALDARAVEPALKKVKDIVIYQDEKFHSAFPSIVRRPDGELLLAFRRAPDRRLLGEAKYSHTDPNSYLVMTRSKDNGESWTEPKLMFAHPFGGSQDPCLLQLKNKDILCGSYAWSLF